MKKITSAFVLLISNIVISQTTISVIAPNGGELFEPGEIVSIDYQLENGEAGDDVGFYYSIDNGASFTWIGDNLFSAPPPSSYTGSYSWTIPLGINSTNCLIRSDVYRTAGGIGVVAEDTTDNVFTISEDITGITSNSLNQVSIYPNPIKGTAIVNLGELSNVTIGVHDITGKLIYTNSNFLSKEVTLDLSKIEGTCFIEISNVFGDRGIFKLINE